MLVPCLRRRLVLTVPLVFVAALLLMEPARSDQEAGTAIPAESMYHTTCTAVLMLQGTTLLTILEVSCLYCFKIAIWKYVLFSLFIQGSLVSYPCLLPIAVLLATEIQQCSALLILCNSFIVLDFSMPWITIFTFQRHSWDLFISSGIDFHLLFHSW